MSIPITTKETQHGYLSTSQKQVLSMVSKFGIKSQKQKT
jgi:hypothetical protein